MRRKLKADPMLAFPPAWRGGMLEDDVRLTTAFEVLNAIANGHTSYYRTSTDPHISAAYTYYIRYDLDVPERVEMLRTIEKLMGVDEDWE